MTRLLLTLLALITGLAAQVSPAQASIRSAGEAEIGAVAQAPRLAAKVARMAARPVAAAALRVPARLLPGLAVRSYATVAVPAVLIRIDRARN